MSILVIVRGLPGSGKSTFAEYLKDSIPETRWLETDRFFVDENGKYVFDRRYLKDFHRMCHGATGVALRHSDCVVVSNTFTTEKELRKYVDTFHPFCKIIVVEMLTQYGSVHDVPEKTLERMKQRWFDISDSIDLENKIERVFRIKDKGEFGYVKNQILADVAMETMK